MQRIGLMGGSFDPIHNAHLALARAALAEKQADEVIFLPAGDPPHKRGLLAPGKDRLSMVRLALEGEPHMRVSNAEVDRAGVTYTVDTLRDMRRAYPDSHLVYLIGSDTLHQIGTWRECDAVISLCSFVVYLRADEPKADVLSLMEAWRVRGADICLGKVRLPDLSSTQVRKILGRGGAVTQLIPPAVESYIRAHALYDFGRCGDGETRKDAL